MSSTSLELASRRPTGRRIMRQVVPALAYHKVGEVAAGAKHRCNYVTPDRFAMQLGYLRMTGFRSISFASYLAYRNGSASLPPRPVLITFDDGYQSLLHSAVPILRRYGFTATFFVVAGLLGGTNVWDADEIQEPLVSAADVRALHAQGFEVQSHTLTHRRLPGLRRDEALRELRESRLCLEGLIDEPVNVVAYPWSDHSADVRQLAKAAGYEAGAILRRRTNFDDTPLLELRRIGVNLDTSLARFGWDLMRLRVRGA